MTTTERRATPREFTAQIAVLGGWTIEALHDGSTVDYRRDWHTIRIAWRPDGQSAAYVGHADFTNIGAEFVELRSPTSLVEARAIMEREQ